MLTADGVPVLIHDETLRRTTSGRGRVSERTLAEIRPSTRAPGSRPSSGASGCRRSTRPGPVVGFRVARQRRDQARGRPRGRHRRDRRRDSAPLGRRMAPRLLVKLRPGRAGGGAAALRPASRAASWRAGCPRIGARRRRPGCATLHLDHPAGLAALGQLVGEGAGAALHRERRSPSRDLLSAGASARSSPTPDLLTRRAGSVAPHQPDQPALDADLVRAEDPISYSWLAGSSAIDAPRRRRRFRVTSRSSTSATTMAPFSASSQDHREVAVVDAGVDHRVADHLQDVVLALAEQHGQSRSRRWCRPAPRSASRRRCGRAAARARGPAGCGDLRPRTAERRAGDGGSNGVVSSSAPTGASASGFSTSSARAR